MRVFYRESLSGVFGAFLLGAVGSLSASTPAHALENAKVLAVLELCEGKEQNKDAPLKQSECLYAADEARRAASDYTAKYNDYFVVITRENIETVLNSMGRSVALCDITGCKVDILRDLNADFGITGNIVRIGKQYVLQMQLYDVKTGVLLKSTNDKYKTAEKLLDDVHTRTSILLQEYVKLPTAAQVAQDQIERTQLREKQLKQQEEQAKLDRETREQMQREQDERDKRAQAEKDKKKGQKDKSLPDLADPNQPNPQVNTAWVPWTLVGTGVTATVGGYLLDRFLPTSQNQEFDALDVLPLALYGASAAAVVTGIVLWTAPEDAP